MKEDKVAMTIVLPKDDRKELKKLALDLDTTVSALVGRWLHEHLERDTDGVPEGMAEGESVHARD